MNGLGLRLDAKQPAPGIDASPSTRLHEHRHSPVMAPRPAEIAVLVPVLARPQNAMPLAVSLAESTDRARLVFICTPSDRSQIEACLSTGAETLVAPFEAGRGDWARKLELARERTSEPFLLLGGDDVRFHPGWADEVIHVYETGDVGVVGTNDLANPAVKRGMHSTHPVVCRGYADLHGTIDDPAVLLHPGYHHLYVDNELVETAKVRGCWAFAADAHVEHLHPIWRTAPRDETYDRGSAEARDDQRLFQARRRLWR